MVASDSESDPMVHLCYGDVRVDSVSAPQYIETCVKVSKTDPFRIGVSVFVGTGTGELCPVSTVLDYMVRRGLAAGLFFMFADGKLLTREHFVRAVRGAMDRAGVDSSWYAGHSFRIGAATTAAQCRLQDSFIKTWGDGRVLPTWCTEHVVLGQHLV